MSEQKTRLTSNLPAEKLGMTELALNNCYVKDRQTMYRDYEAEYDVHDLIKRAAKALGIEINTEDSYDLDLVLFDWLEEGYDTPQGIIALLFSMFWSKAELYNRLKELEDAAEKGVAK